jgi:hypothetical protein
LRTFNSQATRNYLKADEPAAPKVNVKVSQDVLSRYFTDEDKPDAISDTIAQALEAWFAAKNN